MKLLVDYENKIIEVEGEWNLAEFRARIDDIVKSQSGWLIRTKAEITHNQPNFVPCVPPYIPDNPIYSYVPVTQPYYTDTRDTYLSDRTVET